MTVSVVIPAPKIGGGSLEALHLTQDIRTLDTDAKILGLWTAGAPMDAGEVPIEYLSSWLASRRSAAWQLLAIWFRFARLASRKPAHIFVFTHYATLPLAWVISKERRVFFVQDLEWKFIGRTWARSLLRKFILFHYRRGAVVPANVYLAEALRLENIVIDHVYPIWADHRYLRESVAGPADGRLFDVCLMLRNGLHKRPDLQREFIELCITRGQLKLALISLDDQSASPYRGRVERILTRPDVEAMANLYSRTNVFVLLSEHEGFGLPPLEAMGAGCVPLCRDAGGVRAYLDSVELEKLIVSKSTSIAEIVDRVESLCEDKNKLERLSKLSRARFVEGFTLSERRLETAGYIAAMGLQ